MNFKPVILQIDDSDCPFSNWKYVVQVENTFDKSNCCSKIIGFSYKLALGGSFVPVFRTAPQLKGIEMKDKVLKTKALKQLSGATLFAAPVIVAETATEYPRANKPAFDSAAFISSVKTIEASWSRGRK